MLFFQPAPKLSPKRACLRNSDYGGLSVKPQAVQIYEIFCRSKDVKPKCEKKIGGLNEEEELRGANIYDVHGFFGIYVPLSLLSLINMNFVQGDQGEGDTSC